MKRIECRLASRKQSDSLHRLGRFPDATSNDEEISMSGVGTRKVYEDDRVIVWHLDLEPGEHGKTHTHKLDYVVRVTSGSTLEVYGPKGEYLETVELKCGRAVSFHVEGDSILADGPDYPAVPATHSARNIGTTTFREVLVEFKPTGE
jgi:hypothetical protein